jgi:hypothetical protein
VNVVCNTSPLLFLAKIERLALLAALYQVVRIPVAVMGEVQEKTDAAAAAIHALRTTPPYRVHAALPTTLARVPVELGPGERETLALAMDTAADLVILDDQEGRRVARALGLTMTGTVGVLVEAYTRGLLPSVRSELDRLRQAGLWMSEAFYRRLCQLEDQP